MSDLLINSFSSRFLLLISLLFLAFSANGGYDPNQDKEIVGKTLWAYYDSVECQSNFKIYTPNSRTEIFVYEKPIQVKVINFSDNWITGPKYEFVILDENKTNGYMYYNDLNFERGYTKYLYYTLVDVDLVLLKNACLTNVNPEVKANLIKKEQDERILAGKLAKENSEKLRLQKEAERQIEIEKRMSAEAADKAEEVKKQELESKRKENELILEKEKYISQFPIHLKEMYTFEFCMEYGNHIRQESEKYDREAKVISAFNKEIKRRKLTLNNTLIKKQSIKLGVSECQLYASWGMPNDQNESVGSWGVHVQHIYKSNDTYVYTENGKVTSWQD